MQSWYTNIFYQQTSPLTKHSVLDYMQPWLPNLALFCQKTTDTPEKYTKVVEVLNSLIELTIRETSVSTCYFFLCISISIP